MFGQSELGVSMLILYNTPAPIYFIFCVSHRSILEECSVFSSTSFRSSAVLMTTPFWSGISWTSPPTASQRGGLPPAPTRIFLDSRYRSKIYLTQPWMSLYSARPVWFQGLLLPSPTGGAHCLTFFLEEPWADLVMATSITERSLSLLLLSSSSLCPSRLRLLLACSDGLLSLCPLPTNDLQLTHTFIHTGQHRWWFPTPKLTRLSHNAHLLLIYVL